jgi:CheY-like chemotaxis protein
MFFCHFDAMPSFAPPATAIRRPRILVVDDDELVRNVLRLGLQRNGFDVVLAADGWEAVDRYGHKGSAISAVLLDVSMPGLDGPNTLERLQQINPATPMYFMTAGCINYGEQELVGRGALQVFRKPFDLNEIAETLRKSYLRTSSSATS